MQNCVQLNKPVTLDALSDAIQRLLWPNPAGAVAPGAVATKSGPTVYIVDDDVAVRSDLRDLGAILTGLALGQPQRDSVYCFAELSADGELCKLSPLNKDELTALQEAS